ncbi:MAG TPA: zf-HC2 domain-containing protein [Blastocatellia bacterium]|jgi:anti-sigma factor RsiW|nr:zf-HC2 domain-containing protein [Blastocatellia bacterium]
MEHSYIEDHHIADRYLSGKLSIKERMRFEEHFVDCAECLDWLQTIDDFRAGLRTVAAEEAAPLRAFLSVGQAGALARIARLVRRRQAPLLAVIILLTALSTALLVLEWRGARRELAQAQQASSEWRRKYEESEKAVLKLAKETQTPEMKSPDSAPGPSHNAGERQSATPVFALSVVRGDNPDLSQPVNRITLGPQSKSVILSLELEPDPDIHSYRVDISTSDGRSVWTRDGLKPNSKNALALRFNSKLFKPGDYLLTLEGITAQGGRAPVATYAFRALTQ